MKRIFLYIISLFLIQVNFAYKPELKILFRYDDFTLSNDPLQDSILKLFLTTNNKLNIGVIPFNQSQPPQPINSINEWKLKQLIYQIKEGNLEIAQHGFNHCKRIKDEFTGLSLIDQSRLICEGKEFLDSILKTSVTIFIPPWNSYDSNTLIALKKLNFKLISADRFGPVILGGLSYLPCTCLNLSHIKNIIKKNLNQPVILVVLLHNYDFHSNVFKNNSNNTLKDLKSILQFIKINNIKTYTFSNILNSDERLDASRYLLNSSNFSGIISKRFAEVYVPGKFKWIKAFDILFWILYTFVLLLILSVIIHKIYAKLNFKYIVAFLSFFFLFLIFLLIMNKFTLRYLFLFNSCLALFLAILLNSIYKLKH